MQPTSDGGFRWRCPAPCGAPSRWEGLSDRRCFRCQFDALAQHLPKARDDNWTWETVPRLPHLKPAYEAARAWFADYLEGEERNLFMYGPSGLCKSGLAWCIARNDLERGGVPEFVNVRRLLRELRASYSAEEPGEYEEAEPHPYERLRGHRELLVLDDVGAERRTAHALEELAGLVEERYDAGHGPTIVTSNYSPADLARKLGGRRDPVIGERLVSRLLEGARAIRVEGPNLRLLDREASEGSAARLHLLNGPGAHAADEFTEREEEA